MSSNVRIRNDRHYTYADYLKFPEDERWELIDGVAYNMAPAPGEAHQDLAGEIFSQAHAQLRGKTCRAYIAPFDVRFENSETTDTVVQPDVMVFCDRDRLVPRGGVGAPAWVVEVLSPGSASRDHVKKRHLYEREAVREFWVVDPTHRLLTIYRLGTEKRYEASEVLLLTGQPEVRAVPGLAIDWDLWEPLNPAE